MLTGLVPPTSGEGRVAGLDVATERRAVKRSIGYMSQLFSLYADLTVDENIRFFARLYGVPGNRRQERADWVVEMAGLTEHRGRLTGELPWDGNRGSPWAAPSSTSHRSSSWTSPRPGWTRSRVERSGT